MPVAEDMTVQFTTTLFALIRESLQIKMGHANEMDALDRELREAVIKLWPLHAQKKLYLLLPAKSGAPLPVPFAILVQWASLLHLIST